MNCQPSPLRRCPSPTVVFAWAMYDWANSAYSTLLITVVLHYVQETVFPDRHSGPAIFAWSIGAAMLCAAVLSPIIGAMADANRSKRRWLAGTAFCGAAAAVAMALFPPEQRWAIFVALIVTSACFELSLVPYNGFLPEIAGPESINRISAFGFALGYIGGALPLAAAWLICHYGSDFGLFDQALRQRVGVLLLGAWWAAFTLPAVLVLRDCGPAPDKRQNLLAAARLAAAEVRRTLANVRQYKMLALFLLAFLFYNDGMRTVITQSNTLAVKELKFSLDELFALVLVIQLVALPGSLAVGWLGDRFGLKPVVFGCLLVWMGLLSAATVVQTKAQLWAMGIVLATVLGGTQSVSRAMVGLMTPPHRAAEFFGFYGLSGKAASILGPMQFGAVVLLTGNPRLAAVSLLAFFIIGGAILARVNVTEGHRQAIGQCEDGAGAD